jgi:hypothetical protein
MDTIVAFSAGSLIANLAAVLVWTSWVVWHRHQGQHVDWW